MSVPEVVSGVGPGRIFLDNPGYVDFARESYDYFRRSFNSKEGRITLSDMATDLTVLWQHVRGIDFAVLFGAILLVGAARQMLTDHFFKPICAWRKLPEADAKKVPESGWKFVFYLSTWTAIATYMFTVDGMNFLANPRLAWDGYSLARPVESGIYWIYAIELGYYFHSLYTTIAVDLRRKDTPVMMIHHLLTILLMTISFATRTHKTGLLVLFLHDGCDIFLEGTKLMKYFKVQGDKVYHRLEMFISAGFIGFLTSWIVNRLYWFPLVQLYYSSVYVEHLKLHIPFFFLLNAMLWLLLVLNVYWFTFAVILLFKVLSGQLKEIEDTREFKDQPEANSTEVTSLPASPTGSPAVTKGDKSKRKFSCDSGVADNSSDSDEFASQTPSGTGTPESSARTTPIPEEVESIPEGSDDQKLMKKDTESNYNLRHRK